MLPKSFIGLIAAGLVVLAVLGFAYVLLGPGSRPTVPPLPSPNGYDELLKAVEKLREAQSRDRKRTHYRDLNAAELRQLVERNAGALASARAALILESRVPPPVPVRRPSPNAGRTDDVGAMMEVARAALEEKAFTGFKELALAFAAEGRLAELEGRHADAARSYLAAIQLGHAGSRGGGMLHKLVGAACEALGLDHLRVLIPQLNAQQCRELITSMEAREAQRESFKQVLRNEKAYLRRRFGLGVQLAGIVHFRATQQSHAKTKKKLAERELQARTTLVDLAVRAHEQEKSERPKGWTDLVPTYLKAIPLDPSTGKNLDYRF
ncbi:MAG: hypothetical protein HYY24_16240 [Verrucomicrobia bacterium]|nr:hypothetical protein [Verrucomicrobiota bacterium]